MLTRWGRGRTRDWGSLRDNTGLVGFMDINEPAMLGGGSREVEITNTRDFTLPPRECVLLPVPNTMDYGAL